MDCNTKLYIAEIVKNTKGTGEWYCFEHDNYDYIHNNMQIPGTDPIIFIKDPIICVNQEKCKKHKKITIVDDIKPSSMNLEELITHYRGNAPFINDHYYATSPYFTKNPSEVIVTGLNSCLGVFVINDNGIIAIHIVTEPVFTKYHDEKLIGVKLLMEKLDWDWNNTNLLILQTTDKHDSETTQNQKTTINNIVKFLDIDTFVFEKIETGEITGNKAKEILELYL